MNQGDIDIKLGADKFYADLRAPHTTTNQAAGTEAQIALLIKACPAGLYSLEDGELEFSYEGCLECGTCRVIAGGGAIDTWDYPPDGFGVDYRQG